MSFRSDVAKRLVINAFKNQKERELKNKFKKKGVLTKIVSANQKKSNVLVDILRESDSFNTMTSFSKTVQDDTQVNQQKSSNDEYLKKFRSTTVGGPKFSIAKTRAHHLSNFLSDYMINAFNGGLFDSQIEIPAEDKTATEKKQIFSLEISNVELLADLSALQVYWLCSGDERVNAAVETVLDTKLRNQIRQKLIEERVINYVPRIIFCRDHSRVISEKLDEYLAQIDLETKAMNISQEHDEADRKNDEKEEQDHVEKKGGEREQKEVVAVAANETKKKEIKLVNNIYGVDFNRLMEMIRKDGPNTEWKADSQLEKVQAPQASLTHSVAEDHAKFTASLKAFEIHKRQKMEKIKKSTLSRLALIEFENSKEEHDNNS